MGKVKIITKEEGSVDPKEVTTEAPKQGVKVPKKKIVSGTLHIEATFNNTKVVLSDKDGNTIYWTSAGSLGFKGAKKGTPFAAGKAGQVLGENPKVSAVRC
jgi:small subunit ribosomal protein S11